MSDIIEINIKDEIKPNIGVGNIRLGMNISSFFKTIKSEYSNFFKLWDYTLGKSGDISFINLNYKNKVNLIFKTSSGKLGSIELRKGYKGLLWDTIGIESSCREFLKVNNLKVNDFSIADGLLVFKQYPDLIFEIGDNEDFLELDEILKKKIRSIILWDRKVLNGN